MEIFYFLLDFWISETLLVYLILFYLLDHLIFFWIFFNILYFLHFSYRLWVSCNFLCVLIILQVLCILVFYNFIIFIILFCYSPHFFYIFEIFWRIWPCSRVCQNISIWVKRCTGCIGVLNIGLKIKWFEAKPDIVTDTTGSWVTT